MIETAVRAKAGRCRLCPASLVAPNLLRRRPDDPRLRRARGRRRLAVALPLLGFLFCSAGCTERYVTGEAIASNKAVELETNSILVTNILRARDGVPTYHSDISHLRGSLQTQASISAALGVGDYKNWTGRSLVAPGASVQTNPSFDVAPLNTQGFTKGINEPLDVRVFQYYLDRAIPPYTLLELFIDKIEDVRYEAGRATITPTTTSPATTRRATAACARPQRASVTSMPRSGTGSAPTCF